MSHYRQSKPVKGVKDYLPDSANPRHLVVDAIQKIALSYGYDFIETPILEHLDLFKRAVGQETDVVGKRCTIF